jgi:large subunit ribosomal protein L1
MGRTSKRSREIAKFVDKEKIYKLAEAIDILKKCPAVKFDQSVDVSIRLGLDPKKSDQTVRGSVSLPKGTGKKVVVLVFAKGDKVQEALEAGADYVGFEEYFDKVKNGWTGFDAVVSTPDLMREVGKLGKVLGPRNLMPTPKAGTVTNDVAEAVSRVKAGQIDFKMDKMSVINCGIGKLSFSDENLIINLQALMSAILRAKPATAKGQYIRGLYLSSTMGPGVRLDNNDYTAN